MPRARVLLVSPNGLLRRGLEPLGLHATVREEVFGSEGFDDALETFAPDLVVVDLSLLTPVRSAAVIEHRLRRTGMPAPSLALIGHPALSADERAAVSR